MISVNYQNWIVLTRLGYFFYNVISQCEFLDSFEENYLMKNPVPLYVFYEKILTHKIEEIKSMKSKLILYGLLQPFRAKELYSLLKLQVIFNDINLCCIKRCIAQKEMIGTVAINGEIQIIENK